MNLINRIYKPVLSTTITSSVAETTISPAATVGMYLDLYRLTISNSSATGTKVTIRSATAGTVLHTYWVAAGAVVGFSGSSDDALAQLSQTTVANAATNVWTATCSVSVADIVINAEFKRNNA